MAAMEGSWAMAPAGPVSRRTFVHAAAAGPVALTLGAAAVDQPGWEEVDDVRALQRIVKLWGDGQSLTPPEYAYFLSRFLADRGIAVDDYSNGGVVEELERRMAARLGKERGVFLPTGTLANHLALRLHAHGGSRVLVQRESHVYADSGDCAQVLSNVNLVPMATETGTFTREEVQSAIATAQAGRVRTGVAAISIESPIRRRLGRLFDHAEMKRISAFARENGVAMHLDGARLFMASAYTGIDPADYASLFDTVYVSTWKCFSAPSGAILAGPHALLDGLFETRRMFGGSLPGAWPLAALALHFMDGFEERFALGVARGEELKVALGGISGLRVQVIPDGSNDFELWVDEDVDLARMRTYMDKQGFELPQASPFFHGFPVVVNETLVRRPLAELVRTFEKAVRA